MTHHPVLFGSLLITMSQVIATAPAVALASVPSHPGGGNQTATIPANLQVVAEYGSGESDWKSWTVTIGSDGRVTQSIYGEPPRSRTLSRTQLEILVATIRTQKFWRLRPEYLAEATDVPTLILSVTGHGRPHRVRVLLDPLVPQDADVQRFLRVWSEVLRLVPSPNAGQTSSGAGRKVTQSIRG